jgi:hypothetical protein
MAVYKAIQWYKIRNKYIPTAIIESLLKPEETKTTVLLPAPSEPQTTIKVPKNRTRISAQHSAEQKPKI